MDFNFITLKRTYLISGLLFLQLPCGVANAAGLYMSAGYGSAGSNLSELTGGQNYNTRTGDGLVMMLGTIIPISPTIPHRFETQLGFGFIFQSDSRQKENAVTWTRNVIEAIYYYRNTQEHFRFGWGPIYHFNNKIEAKGANAPAGTSVDSSLGWAIAAEKLISTQVDKSQWGFGMKYNVIKYRSAKFIKEADANCLFLTVSGNVF